MTETKIQPVIMSGGAGTRLWPMSRQMRPKQFLPLVTSMSLFQETAERLSGDDAVNYLAPLVIAGAGHAQIVAAQLEAIGRRPAAIIIEPCARNTAAVAAVAAAWIDKNATGALALLAPADQHIADAPAFRRAVIAGAPPASKGAIVTFGVKPDSPHTGYGYIEAGAPMSANVAEVAAFREKPDIETARHYLAGGRHFWNAGIFLFAPETMLGELHAFAPAIRNAAVASLAGARIDGAVIHLDAERFAACPSDSIDYAVMEKTKRAAVVGPVDAGWNDIGSWTALADANADQRIGAIDCNGSIIRSDGPFIGAIGLDDMIVVATGDAVLVAPKSRAQDVKKIVDLLKSRQRGDLL